MGLIAQSWVQVGTICAVLVAALIYQTHYIDKRFEAVDKRFDDLKDWIRAELRRIDERLDSLTERVAKIEEKLEQRITSR
jgi:hypothetical protein